MKKLGLLAATAVAATVLGFSSADAYPPGLADLTVAPSTVTTSSPFIATFVGCVGTETVNFEVDGATVSATCGAAAAGWRRPGSAAVGSATTTLTAPAEAGTYPVTATGATSARSATATLTVVASAPGTGGTLPATGSDTVEAAGIAAGLVATGIGLVVVGGGRRRRLPAA